MDVRVPTGNVFVQGNLEIPESAGGIVAFAHGSGSSRFSRRNRYVAATLRERYGLGTLLCDLLTPDEEVIDLRTAEYRFDIPRLARRVVDIIDWLARREETMRLPIGLFGSSTGAAAALIAAAERPNVVGAVVSRGGRPDLAGAALGRVFAPTLLIVGGRDYGVLDLNRMALEQLAGEARLEIVPGATHLFEEPGALEEVARLAGEWFRTYLIEVAEQPSPAAP